MLRVAAIQLCAGDDPVKNLDTCRTLFDQAMERNPDLIAFPENFTCSSENSRLLLRQAEEAKDYLIPTLQEWAAENDVWILAGGTPVATKKKKGETKKARKYRNSSILIDSSGDVLATYDKMHLFDANLPGQKPFRESGLVEPGKKPVVAETPWGRIGLSICYDLRFPEMYRAYADAGCVAVFAPSSFTERTGRAHWDVLTRARAVENLFYVVAPAQWGEPIPGRKMYGHTRIVNPWGRVIAERPAGDGVVWADLDFSDMERIRRELPALKHRVL